MDTVMPELAKLVKDYDLYKDDVMDTLAWKRYHIAVEVRRITPDMPESALAIAVQSATGCSNDEAMSAANHAIRKV